MSLRCPQCGNENLEPANVCQVCAAPLHAESNSTWAPIWATPAQEQPLTTQLYQAAIGPVRTAYYLEHFARFDARGKGVLTWHWPAFFFTLGWMAFRRLWKEALVYALLCTLLGLGLLAFVPATLGYSESVIGAAIGIYVLLASVPPALLANSLYYRSINRHVTQALAQSPDIASTQDRLRHYASSRPRALIFAAALFSLWLATAALVAWFWWPDDAATKAPPPAKPPAASASQPLRATSQPSAQASAPMPPASAAAAKASTPTATASAAAPGPAPSLAVSAPLLAASRPPVAASVASSPEPVKTASTAAKPKAVAPAKAAQLPEAPPVGNWLVAAGVFAQEDNAQRVQKQLLDLGLPVQARKGTGRKGEFTRVLVGPFGTRQQARQAVEQIESAGLSAAILEPR
jgi:cell division septation protein DedD